MNGDSGGSVKRKADDSEAGNDRLPTSKKLRHVEGKKSEIPNVNAVKGMHSSIMNGPTLSPQGQISRPDHYENGNSPPGLASPSRPTNGIVHHSPATNGQHPPQTHITPPRYSVSSNGQSQSGRDAVGAARSDRYPPYYSSQLPTSNPFLNSFERQPSSMSYSTQHLPSPMKNRPSMSPTQGNRNVSSLTDADGTTPNGHTHTSLPSATHPTAYDPPTKPLNTSPPPPATSLYSSSPIMPPPTHKHEASLSGISPSKNSPPRPPSSHSLSMTPIIPPTANLEPSPQVQNLSAPIKAMTQEQLRMSELANGHSAG